MCKRLRYEPGAINSSSGEDAELMKVIYCACWQEHISFEHRTALCLVRQVDEPPCSRSCKRLHDLLQVYTDYGYRTEMMRAMERHEWGEARVIPVIHRQFTFSFRLLMTCTAHRLRQQVQQKYAGGEVSCSYCKVLPQCTPRMLIELLYSLLVSSLPQPASGQRKHRATQSIFVDLLSASQQFRKQLLILDEVELLHPGCYDLLRQLFEETGCPFLLLGTSKLSIKIQQNALFASHIGLGMIFAPPTEHEMLLSILPQLTIPGWSFDPGSDADLELGEEIWHAVNPSLRRLMVLLQAASQLADSTNGGRITRDVLRQVFGLLAFPPKNSLSASKAEKKPDPRKDGYFKESLKKGK